MSGWHGAVSVHGLTKSCGEHVPAAVWAGDSNLLADHPRPSHRRCLPIAVNRAPPQPASICSQKLASRYSRLRAKLRMAVSVADNWAAAVLASRAIARKAETTADCAEGGHRAEIEMGPPMLRV